MSLFVVWIFFFFFQPFRSLSRFWRRPACDSVLPAGSRPRAERFPCVRSPKAGFRRRHPVRTVCFCRRSGRPGDPQKLRDLLAAHDGRSGVPLPCASRQNAAPERLPTVAAVLQERPCDRLSSYGSCGVPPAACRNASGSPRPRRRRKTARRTRARKRRRPAGLLSALSDWPG